MKKQGSKKLTLTTETVRSMQSASELGKVAGGLTTAITCGCTRVQCTTAPTCGCETRQCTTAPTCP